MAGVKGGEKTTPLVPPRARLEKDVRKHGFFQRVPRGLLRAISAQIFFIHLRLELADLFL